MCGDCAGAIALYPEDVDPVGREDVVLELSDDEADAVFTEGVMYQIQPRAFTPEGTLKAAEKRLPYLKDLGVTIAYLVPVMKMDTSTDRSAPGAL